LSLHRDIPLDGLKKKLAEIPDPNPEKGHVLHLDNTRPHLAHREIQAKNLSQLSHPAYRPDLVPTNFLLLGI
jgi:hypothetical protein